MATTTALKLEFNTSEGKTTTLSYKYVKSNPTDSSVKALISAIISNGAIFASQPISAKSAKLVQTTENVLDIGS